MLKNCKVIARLAGLQKRAEGQGLLRLEQHKGELQTLRELVEQNVQICAAIKANPVVVAVPRETATPDPLTQGSPFIPRPLGSRNSAGRAWTACRLGGRRVGSLRRRAMARYGRRPISRIARYTRLSGCSNGRPDSGAKTIGRNTVGFDELRDWESNPNNGDTIDFRRLLGPCLSQAANRPVW